MKAIAATRRLFADWMLAAWHILRFAPWLLLPILLTEGAQHVAEIRLGMFESRAEFIASSNDPTRWMFGYAKVAGLLVSMLLVARTVALGSAARAIRPRWQPLVTLAALLATTFALDQMFQSTAARAVAPDAVLQGINIVLQTLLTVPLLAALFEDDWTSLRGAGWRVASAFIVSLLLGALAFVPMQLLHMANHSWALGAPSPTVWALMLFDTLVVGVLALMVGSGLAVGWRQFVRSAAPMPPSTRSPAPLQSPLAVP